ncbi:putative inactive heme oxygenase 2, chloroplastic [Drosera capensis]
MTTLQWRPTLPSPPPLHLFPPPPHSPLFPRFRLPKPPKPLSCTTTTPTPITESPESSSPPTKTKKKVRYRKPYPGETKGITEELRFVAMRLRHERDKVKQKEGGEEGEGEEWEPTAKGLLKYLVDSKVVFETVEGVVEESEDVALAYFRNTGLERSSRIDIDLQSFREKDMLIPEPSKAGLSYAKYLKELSEKSVPSFISHLYTIYFSHISGGQAILKQVAEKILDGRELEITKWDDDPQVLLREVKDKFNKLAEHWPRIDKDRCLRESGKSYKFLGQIVRLIVSI